jgi:hypothetical protein
MFKPSVLFSLVILIRCCFCGTFGFTVVILDSFFFGFLFFLLVTGEFPVCYNEGNGAKDFTFEINYRFAMDKDDFINQWNSLSDKPSIQSGTIIE